MKSVLARALRPGVRRVLQAKARRKLDQFGEWDETVWGAEQRALAQALGDRFDDAEQAWIKKIESLRQSLEARTDTVTLTDFGAGRREQVEDGANAASVSTREETVGDVCRSSSKAPFWARQLFALVRHRKPQQLIELGCCLGLSASYQGAALELNGGGRMTTMEGAPSLAALASENLSSLGLEDRVSVVEGSFDETLATTAARLAPIDYAFIDGHHEESATLRYFEVLKPRLASKALVVFDDISWSKGMKRAWAAVENDPLVKASIDLRAVGLAILDGDAERQGGMDLPLV